MGMLSVHSDVVWVEECTYDILLYCCCGFQRFYSKIPTSLHGRLESLRIDQIPFGKLAIDAGKMSIASDCAELKKCILCAPFGMLLGHIVCKKGLLVDLMKIAVILSFRPPKNMNMLRETLGHTWYYRKFIRG